MRERFGYVIVFDKQVTLYLLLQLVSFVGRSV